MHCCYVLLLLSVIVSEVPKEAPIARKYDSRHELEEVKSIEQQKEDVSEEHCSVERRSLELKGWGHLLLYSVQRARALSTIVFHRSRCITTLIFGMFATN